MYALIRLSSLLNLGSLIESVLDPNRPPCSVRPDLGTNYLQSILSDGFNSKGMGRLTMWSALLDTQEFVYLCEKLKRIYGPKAICTHVLIEKEI